MFFSAKMEQEKIDNEVVQENLQQEAFLNTSKIADRHLLLLELKDLV